MEGPRKGATLTVLGFQKACLAAGWNTAYMGTSMETETSQDGVAVTRGPIRVKLQ